MLNIDTSGLPEVSSGTTQRHILQPNEELRVEVPFSQTHSHSCSFTLQKGSCELFGCELAVGKTYHIYQGGCHLALLSWHGCVMDVDTGSSSTSTDSGGGAYQYVCDDTDCHIAYVNTHAQLEALRDDAVKDTTQQGPRVLIVGPSESGKSTVAKTLVAYACKLGRTPIWVDLDPLDNALSVPGSLCAAPMSMDAITVETYATCGLPANTSASPLVMWHGSATELNPELFQAQVESLATKMNARLDGDDLARSSGIIVNTNGSFMMPQDNNNKGLELLTHTAKVLDISVILVMGHDRLYSALSTHFQDTNKESHVKVIKLPRSDGIVNRSLAYLRSSKSRAVKRYFEGERVDPSSSSSTTTASTSTTTNNNNNNNKTEAATSTMMTKVVPQLTPFLLQISFSELTIYKVRSVALSASLLPVAAAQSTDAIQLQPITTLSETLHHALLGVCHPAAVERYLESGKARELVASGMAGFCAVEQVLVDTDQLHLLSPCAGSLPSKTLILGDVTWME